ncbi:hypothetical protein ACOSP7_014316 [Xanthoceras sorbifolium]
MASRGPSPLVPFVIVGVLGFTIFGPTLLAMVESVLQIFQADLFFVMVLLLLSMLIMFIQLLSIFFPSFSFSSSPGNGNQQTSSSGFDSDGFGLGSLLMVVLFFVLYGVM